MTVIGGELGKYLTAQFDTNDLLLQRLSMFVSLVCNLCKCFSAFSRMGGGGPGVSRESLYSHNNNFLL